jgi:hypothetical protein
MAVRRGDREIYEACTGAEENSKFSQYLGIITKYWDISLRPLKAKFFHARFQGRRLQP